MPDCARTLVAFVHIQIAKEYASMMKNHHLIYYMTLLRSASIEPSRSCVWIGTQPGRRIGSIASWLMLLVEWAADGGSECDEGEVDDIRQISPPLKQRFLLVLLQVQKTL
uniref:Uncharacterized protein n=1 Tax=Leersia perrieri TaxID=77586 RepID=A0A0D9W009_9ORYZ